MIETTAGLEATLSRKFRELSPQLQRAARYIIENPQDVATHSLRQIARRSDLTPPTYSRLARSIGLEDYESLKEICRSELKRNTFSLSQRAAAMTETSPGQAQGSAGTFAERHLYSTIGNLHHMLEKLDLAALADTADCLARAGHVGLLGALSSRAALEYMHHMVSIAHPGWTMIRPESEAPGTFITGISNDTVILVVSINPYVERTIRMAELAHERGAEIIAISDDIASPVLKHAHRAFLVPTESPQFFPSYAGILTLLEILTGMLVRRWGEDANRRIDDVEKMSHAIGDYC